MAKLIEAYSRNTGLEIGKPFLMEKFYPLDAEKYITIQTGSGMAAKNYDFWQEVVVQIKPILEANKIKINSLSKEIIEWQRLQNETKAIEKWNEEMKNRKGLSDANSKR
jgi:hypothetical protein